MDSTSTKAATGKSVSGTKRLWMAIILGSLSAFGPLSLDMYLPALPALADDLDTSTSLAQLSLTACMLGLSLGQLLAGPLSDVRGRRMPLLVGLLVYAVSSVLCVWTTNIWAFLALRFIQGLAGAAGIVISRAMVRDVYSGTELTKFFSLLMLVNGAAPILAPIIGAQILRFGEWPTVFIVLAAYGLLMLVAVGGGLGETLPPERRMAGGVGETLRTFKRLIADRTFMGYALTQGFIMAGMFAYISGSPFVLQDIYGVSPQTFSLVFALNGLGIILATQITGRVAGKFGEAKLLVIGMGLAFIGGFVLLAMLAIEAPLAAVLPPLFFVVASVGVVSTSGFSLALQNHGQNAGSASALLGLLSFIIGGIAAPFVGIAGEDTALPLGIVIAIAELSAVICYLLLVRGGRKQV
ncbi:DHA1 family bicyclomycin/chloramphenicol resistance-like MFS transporter [Paenibacillus phyllosphaerae]|uniref:Bcr/CflA family efflux transporter n=1 Tax=Paenibacillus phyllosphaerae TaxID=274593 RepID=A0A7W5FP60_9BACL|nr:multidrug effflux MFS transporter [Paenibacillus phyllosphaerae]MBB3111898.1 DHA1 family bicyclomycin/chloramphenicol resistance-like MFS transporter [Paenibacillus phyllosphaerae]